MIVQLILIIIKLWFAPCLIGVFLLFKLELTQFLIPLLTVSAHAAKVLRRKRASIVSTKDRKVLFNFFLRECSLSHISRNLTRITLLLYVILRGSCR
jgi:hypothetical protein